MAQRWKFIITDPDHELVFYVNGNGTVTDENGEITDIFKSSKSIVQLHNLVPQIVGLMKVNSVNKLEVDEEEIND